MQNFPIIITSIADDKNKILRIWNDEATKHNKKIILIGDRNNSTIYIPFNKRYIYFQSAIWGGRCKEILELCFTLRNQVEEDYINNIIAIWHDESHVNSYFYNYKFPKVLSPSYLYPEGYQLPYKPKILMLDKSKKSDRTFSYFRRYEWKEKQQNNSTIFNIIKRIIKN